jgi:hypothetical protein
MKVAIHQPNFVPWRPFFAKMAAVNIFVVLTKCQFNRRVYQHRFKFQEHWYSMSVQNIQHFEPIEDKKYACPHEDWAAIKRKLPQYADWFSQFDDCIHAELWRCNTQIIVRMAALLGIKTEIVMEHTSTLTGTDRLVEICYCLGAKTYLAGRSGASYMDSEKFTRAGIAVEHQEVTDTRHVFEA